MAVELVRSYIAASATQQNFAHRSGKVATNIACAWCCFDLQQETMPRRDYE